MSSMAGRHVIGGDIETRRVSKLKDQFCDGRKRGIMKMVMLEAPHGVVVTDWWYDGRRSVCAKTRMLNIVPP